MKVNRTINAVAKAVGIPASTIRYYERAGLLQPTGRTEVNYRFCDESALDRLRFIRAAQATGFTLANIATLLGSRDVGGAGGPAPPRLVPTPGDNWVTHQSPVLSSSVPF